jgi:CAF1 family ribonuclease
MEIKSHDQPLINHIRNTLRKWQNQKKKDQEHYQNIPAETREKGVPETLNRYQLRLTHQIIRNEYPKLKTTGMGSFIQVTNPTDEQQASEKANRARERERQIANAVGFRWLIDAIIGNDISRLPDECLLSTISSVAHPKDRASFLDELQTKLRTRRKVLVGHNCLVDLMYLYRCFIGDLPDKVKDFQDLIHEKFPAVVDTKYMATYPKKWNTGLEEVEQGLRTEVYPRVEVPTEFDRYQFNERHHEAGYDSFLTAIVAIKLSAKMVKGGSFTLEKAKGLNTQLFGVDDEEYFTVAESPTDDESINNIVSTNIVNALTSPVETAMGFFQTPQASAQLHFENGAKGRDESAAHQSQTEVGPIPIVRRKQVQGSKPKDTQRAKAFDNSNIFDVLREESDGSSDQIDNDGTSDLMSFSNHEENTSDADQARRIGDSDGLDMERKVAAMARKGEMMPRWDGENGFWLMFGNRLQVNGCKEGVCRLS